MSHFLAKKCYQPVGSVITFLRREIVTPITDIKPKPRSKQARVVTLVDSEMAALDADDDGGFFQDMRRAAPHTHLLTLRGWISYQLKMSLMRFQKYLMGCSKHGKLL